MEGEQETSTTTTTTTKDRGYDCINCDACGSNNPRMNCGRCRMVFYCGRECQKQHWRTHKVDCIPIEEMRARFAGAGGGNPSPEAPPETKTATTTPLNSECGICLDEPMTDPVVLSRCRHAFCFECLQSLNRHHSDGPAPCPLCRNQTTVEKDVKEAAIEDASVYLSRAAKRGTSPEEQKKWCSLALEELEKILSTNDEHIQALCIKAQVLAICDPQQALALYQNILLIDKEGSEYLRKMNGILDEVRIAMDAGNEEEAERLLDICEETTNAGGRQQQIGQGAGRLFDICIQMAEVHEALEDWTSAFKIYIQLIQETGDGTVGTAPQQRMMFAGVSRCSYCLGQYDRAIAAAQAALQMNRYFPGVHKLLALPLRAQGKLDEAREVMARAVVYEAPWYSANRQEQIAFKKELDEADS